MAHDLREIVLLRLEALEQQVAVLRSAVGHHRSETDAERSTVMARLRALEEAAATGRQDKDNR